MHVFTAYTIFMFSAVRFLFYYVGSRAMPSLTASYGVVGGPNGAFHSHYVAVSQYVTAFRYSGGVVGMLGTLCGNRHLDNLGNEQ